MKLRIYLMMLHIFLQITFDICDCAKPSAIINWLHEICTINMT